jgi:alkylation response protein AidB-like acyl-CoA dehydrogenase
MAQATAPQLCSDRDSALPGGGYLVGPVPRQVFTREGLSEEQLLFVETSQRFFDNEIWPRMPEIEAWAKDGDGLLVLKLLREAAELGLCSIEVPEAYDGLGLDLTTGMAVAETMRGCASFGATVGAHNGIGMLPIVYFGSDEQKKEWLPVLSAAEKISCYALTEPGNGSDALWGRSEAVLSDDGSHYLLNGQKQFITNGGYADVAIVFANIQGKYSALIVDLHSEGVSRGAEEKKMGIRGSSTTGLIFQDVKVPAANLLGKVGDAPKIALNILYIGRMKLGFATMGSAKKAIDLTIEFMRDRKQFGRSILEFDLQQAKLAEMVCWTYAADSVCYRVVGQVDEDCGLLPEGHTALDEVGVMRRYGLECALIKVLCSETLSKVLYHAVRMHGGYGFCEEYHVERLARDNVVDTIYEGTNDINRIVLSGALAESVYMGTIPFREALEQIHAALRDGDLTLPTPEGQLGGSIRRVMALKRLVAWAAERILIGVGKDVRTEQQATLAVSDALIALHAAESTLSRVLTLGPDHEHAEVLEAVVRLVVHESVAEVERVLRDPIDYASTPQEAAQKRAEFERLLGQARQPEDVIRLKRKVAQHVAARGSYDL